MYAVMVLVGHAVFTRVTIVDCNIDNYNQILVHLTPFDRSDHLLGEIS